MAFQDSGGHLWEACTAASSLNQCMAKTTGGLSPVDTGLAMAAGSSPSLAYTTTGGGTYEVAFQGGNGHLWTTGTFGTEDLGLSMMPGTSPAIAQFQPVAQGGTTFVVAFQDNTGNLVSTVLASATSVTTTHWGLPMDTKSSPAITGVANDGYEMAYHASNNAIALAGTLGTALTGLGMAGDTSPSIAAVNGGYQVAFQANGGDLWTTGTLGTGDLGLGMDNATSPSIANVGHNFYGNPPTLSTTYEIAFQANTGHLWTTGNAGLTGGDSGQAMQPGTSPAIRGTFGLESAGVTTGYTVAYQSSTGVLSFYDVINGHPVNTSLGMDNPTSPGLGGGNQL